MKNYLVFLCATVALCAFSSPSIASAKTAQTKIFPLKTMVAQSAQPVAHKTTMALYTISFSITALGADVFLPSGTERLTQSTTTGKAGVEFALYDGDKKQMTKGLTGSFLYSSSKPQNGTYKVKKRSTETFTLVAVYDNTKGIPDVYHMEIDGIRYTLGDTRALPLLEIHGLALFKTKEVQLAE